MLIKRFVGAKVRILFESCKVLADFFHWCLILAIFIGILFANSKFCSTFVSQKNYKPKPSITKAAVQVSWAVINNKKEYQNEKEKIYAAWQTKPGRKERTRPKSPVHHC